MEKKVIRIIDVNLNRSTEGLRVVEEVCRFILEDKRLTSSVKGLRGQIASAGRLIEKSISDTSVKEMSRLLFFRESGADVGRKTFTKSEAARASINDVFRANLKRAQEAVRCLEEFSKLIDPAASKIFKEIRFKVYTLEKTISKKLDK